MGWYKTLVAKLTLTDVMPSLAHDTEVCRLDAERERLAREYEAADGAVLRKIAQHLKNDGSGRWSEYVRYRTLPGATTPHERMDIAKGQSVDVVRFDSAAVYQFTHCPDCGNLLPKCICPTEKEIAQYGEDVMAHSTE